jgi:hypothetical protein
MGSLIENIVDKAWENKSLKEICKASPEALQGVSKGDADKLKEAFGIDTIAELASNKYFLNAQALCQLAKYEK